MLKKKKTEIFHVYGLEDTTQLRLSSPPIAIGYMQPQHQPENFLKKLAIKLK